jgi:hypothetical protein
VFQSRDALLLGCSLSFILENSSKNFSEDLFRCDDAWQWHAWLVVCPLFVAVQNGGFEGVFTGVLLITGPVDRYKIDLSMIFFIDV